MMIRNQDGTRSYNTRYFRSLAMEWDRDHVILRLVAENSGGYESYSRRSTHTTSPGRRLTSAGSLRS